MTTLSLYELNSLVRQVIDQQMSREYWVQAELAELRESRGHCYMELVEKDEQQSTPIARASAKCWRNTWMLVRPHFERATGQPLHAGLKVRLKVYAQFHEAYGFSWIVTDIDPTFTLGDMAQRRLAIMRQLKEEGVFDLQRELQLPLFCQRIAVISSQTAAGYGDFCHQLSENTRGLQFHTQLFPAIMQGEQVEQSIIGALNRIYDQVQRFDVVVIIRGGGATSDLSGFDTLALAENVAQFPLPIITGIGHDRDECILDMVSHLRVKTPTAAAAFLISHLEQVFSRIENAEERLITHVQMLMEREQVRLNLLSQRLPALFSVVSTRHQAHISHLHTRLTAAIGQQAERHQNRLQALSYRLQTLTERLLMQERHRIDLLSQRAEALNPTLLLKRGYSITLHKGHAVRDARQLQPGEHIETRLATGTIKSIVE